MASRGLRYPGPHPEQLAGKKERDCEDTAEVKDRSRGTAVQVSPDVYLLTVLQTTINLRKWVRNLGHGPLSWTARCMLGNLCVLDTHTHTHVRAHAHTAQKVLSRPASQPEHSKGRHNRKGSTLDHTHLARPSIKPKRLAEARTSSQGCSHRSLVVRDGSHETTEPSETRTEP